MIPEIQQQKELLETALYWLGEIQSHDSGMHSKTYREKAVNEYADCMAEMFGIALRLSVKPTGIVTHTTVTQKVTA